jgi:hypothetical protein
MTISITRDQAKRFLFSGWHGLTNAHIPERKICRFVHEKETECSLPNKACQRRQEVFVKVQFCGELS